jgi:hypothetical protein
MDDSYFFFFFDDAKGSNDHEVSLPVELSSSAVCDPNTFICQRISALKFLY